MSLAAIALELQRVAAARETLYLAEVKKGRMTRAQSEYGVGIFRNMAEDMRRLDAAGGSQWRARDALADAAAWPLGAAKRYSWGERRSALSRELTRLHRIFPEWVRQGKITSEEAAGQIERIACALDTYEDGLDWPGTQQEYWQIYVDRHLRRGSIPRETLAQLLPDCTFPAEQTQVAV
jgi:hypothetical protein